MQRDLSLGAVILLIGTIWMGAGTALARQSCATPGAWKPTPQERIVQRDIQEAIDQGLEEREAKDIEALSRQISPDFTLRLVDGTTLNREQSLEGIRQDLQTVLQFHADRSYTHVECLNLAGNEATVYTKQQYVRTMPDRKDGSPHEAITSVRHRETWLYTKDRWVNRRIEEIERGTTYLDGEPYDPR
jgi:hypothetical protein